MVKRLIALFLILVVISPLSPSAADDWMQWKGANRDNISSSVGLIRQWPEGGPKLLWQSNELGGGYSNLIFYEDYMYTLGDIDGFTQLVALNRSNGKVVWTCKIDSQRPAANAFSYPGPRSTPATDGAYIYAVTEHGILLCADLKTGKELWRKDYRKDYNGSAAVNSLNFSWGYSESPLLIDDKIIVTPGGDEGAVVALDKKTGKLIWRSTERGGESSYASITPVIIGNVRQLLALTSLNVFGLDIETGKVLWDTPFENEREILCTDPVVQKDVLFVTCAYNVGSRAYRIKKKADGSFAIEQIYDAKRIDNKNHGLILRDGYLYSSTERRQLVCLDIATGAVLWKHERINGGKVALAFADGLLFCRGENGEITLVEDNPKEYVEKGTFMQPERTDCNAWTYPLIIEGKMYIRDQQKLFCYSLTE